MLFWLRNFLVMIFFAIVVLAAVTTGLVWFFFGAGAPYGDMTSEPELGPDALTPLVTMDRPIGDVAVAADGRIFFALHPEAPGPGPRIFEWVDGAATPFPAPEAQAPLGRAAGLSLDAEGRLWVVAAGNHGLGEPRLMAFDTDTGQTVVDHRFADDVAPWGSYLRDLVVDAEGGWVYIADAGVLARRPALVVYNIRDRRAHRSLSRHETVAAKSLLIRPAGGEMAWAGGLFSLKAGVSALTLSDDREWLYWAATSHDTIYRIPVANLHNPNFNRIRVAVDIETVGLKPISGGLALDALGNVYIGDVEHGAVLRLTRGRDTVTVVRDARIRWADGMVFGPDGALYVADGALPQLMFKGEAAVEAAGPYHVWRFTPPEAPPALEREFDLPVPIAGDG